MYFSWHDIARKEIGVKELVGVADNPRIIQYHSSTTLRATDDEVPWCSSFVNWCMMKAGYARTKSAAAKSWMNWGVAIKEPVKGCIVVLSRPGGNHVGIYEGEADGVIRLLGGNQDDAVNIRLYRTNRILGYRMPSELHERDQLIYNHLSGAV